MNYSPDQVDTICKDLGVSPDEFAIGRWEFFVLIDSITNGYFDAEQLSDLPPGVCRVMHFFDAELGEKIDARIAGGRLTDRAPAAVSKMIALVYSDDARQSRVALNTAAALLRRQNTDDPAWKVLAAFIETFEEARAPRKGAKIRVKIGRGRKSAAEGGARVASKRRELLLAFVHEHGRLPKTADEYADLAARDGGVGTEASRITGLRRIATELRHGGPD